jgi:hypothetical protein
MFYVKVREKGKKAFWFLKSDGRTTRLKIHAGVIETKDNVEKLLKVIKAECPELEAKVVKIAA